MNVFVFRVPLGNDDIVFEGSARKTMEVHALNFDHVGRIPECLFHVAVFEDTVPDLVRTRFFMQDAGICQCLLRIDDRAAGRELVRRLLPLVDSGLPSADPGHDAWLTVAFTANE